MGTTETNLTGVWQGLYSYSWGEAVSFTAILIETGSHLSGSTHEPCTVPGCALATHEAFLQGTRQGSSVTFTKSYAPMTDAYQSADYAGTLNADSSEIEGHWTLPILGSGKFLMIRTPGATATQTEKKLQKA